MIKVSSHPKTRVMNLLGAVALACAGVALFANKVYEQPPGILAAIVVMYLVLTAIPAGTYVSLSPSAAWWMRVTMLWANWALIALWACSAVAGVWLLGAKQIGTALAGIVMFVIPQAINIHALKSILKGGPPQSESGTAQPPEAAPRWKRLVGRGGLIFIVLVTVAMTAVLVQINLQHKGKPQTEFLGIPLGAAKSEVRFLKGAPSPSHGDEDRWVYESQEVGTGGTYVVTFKDDHVRYVIAIPTGSTFVSPPLMGFSFGDTYQDVQAKLGRPSNVSIAADDLTRTLCYDDYNVCFGFSKGKVEMYGIFDPKTGPIRLTNEKPTSGGER
jgi:hypothetical protein